MKLDHVYVSVENMERAISFYEDLLAQKITHLEEDTWADFDLGNGVYFGLINPKYVGNKRIVGNNTVPVFFADDVDEIFEKVKKYNVKIISQLEELPYTDYHYKCFQCEDTEGNLIEVANYDRGILKG